MKILYWEITYNKTVLYSILAENESIKITGSIFQWFNFLSSIQAHVYLHF